MKGITQDGRHSIATIILFSTFLSGMLLGVASYHLLEEQTMELASSFRRLVMADSKIQTAFNIFLKNSQAALIMLITGPTIVLPFMAVFANGFIAGLIIQLAVEHGKPLWRIILGLIPHGIPELTAFFLTATAGMDIGLSAVRPRGKPRLKAAFESAKKALKTYITRVLPLLLAAALVETYISQPLVQ